MGPVGPLSATDPRVEPRVCEVDEGRKEDDEEGAEKRDAHDRRQVETADVLGRILADAVQLEDGLRENGAAADSGAEVEAEERDDRDQRVTDDMLDEDASRGKTLGPGRAD